jgi:hypothetical protein
MREDQAEELIKQQRMIASANTVRAAMSVCQLLLLAYFLGGASYWIESIALTMIRIAGRMPQ